MRIIREESLYRFEAWCGAEDTINIIIENNCVEAFEDMIEELYPKGITSTELNDLLRFDAEYIFETLGIEEEEEEEEEGC